MILFSHSNFLVHDAKQQAKMRPYSPLSTLIAAALVRRAGHEVALFDATFAPGLDAFEAMLDAIRPHVVVVMEDNFNFLTKMCTTVRRETALAMIRAAAIRGCRVAANGPDVSDNPAMYLCAGADAVVLGEGESALLELVDHWESGAGELARIPGLILPDLGATRPRRAQQDLDALPHPAWDLLDIAAYRAAWTGAHGALSWNIATSRGCPYACNWCAKPTFGRRYTVRSPEDVVREMARLKREVAPEHLWFTDDILGLDVDWTCAFADEVRRADAAIPFTMQSRVNLMTERSVAALAEAGARDVWLGVESGSQAILDAMDKGSTVDAARSATRTLKAHGIKACWFIQLGYPSESWDDLIATRDLIRDEAPDEIGVSVAYPLPGTDFYEQVRAQLGRQRNWKDTGDLAMLFQGTYDTAFYRKVRDLLHREVETGERDDLAWARLEEQTHDHRSPSPFRLAVGS
ncbi:MAG: B12-binding domain-containing radical SAM protein [Sphingomonas sp.]|uniref:B12-binding domain-containing radical SAM protein n=1 Tax=Sphingomonas sp. TaxID=28214 RepID=UPI003F81DD1F